MSLIRVSPFDGELAVSVVARAAAINVVTPSRLFSKKENFFQGVGGIRDFGKGLSQYCTCFGYQQSIYKELLLDRTIIQYFVEAEQIAAIEREASARQIKNILRLGNQLRLCKQCYQEDLDRHGVGFWKTDHQWPLTEVCLRHGALLSTILLKNEIRLPQQEDIVDFPTYTASSIINSLIRIARSEEFIVHQRRNGTYEQCMAESRAQIKRVKGAEALRFILTSADNFLRPLKFIGLFAMLGQRPFLTNASAGFLHSDHIGTNPMYAAILHAVLPPSLSVIIYSPS